MNRPARQLCGAILVSGLACGGSHEPPVTTASAPPSTPATTSVTPPPALPSPPPATAGTTTPLQATPLFELPYTPSLDVAAMDRSADPCVDFYQYTCGGWVKNNPLPADQASWSVYGKLTDENRRFLWGILQQDQEPRADRTPVQQKIGDYFAACMDEAAIEGRGAAPLKPSLDAVDAMPTIHELAPVVARLQLALTDGYASHVLFGFGEDQDFANSSSVIAFARAGGLGLPDRDYYTAADARSAELRTKYVAHVARMLELLGDSHEVAAQGAAAVMRIESDLASASLTRVEQRDPRKLFHKLTRTQLQALTPSFDWTGFLAAAGVPSVATLNVTEPAFYTKLDSELKAVPLADWKTYLRWHLVHAKAHYLSSAFVDEDFDFYSHVLRGVPVNRPRWKRCVSWIDDQLGEALGEEFVRRTFTADTKERARKMTAEIELAMENDLRALTWMGPQTRAQALAKLHSIINKIGYPDKFRDYGPVAITRDDFAGDVERAITFESRRELAKIGKPVDRGEWGMTPPTVNAYYSSQMNDVNFPAGVLQPPLFDPKLDDAPNYGNTGSTIGHELTHGFDDEGRRFDAKGNLRDWWTPRDAAAFESRAQCVVDQYAGYTIVDDIKINSKLTEGEDVADLGGTILAYAAWRHAERSETLASADGLTPDQRFFVGFAQWACENERPENLRLNARTNPHSPGIERVNGIVSNMKEFQDAFSCKAGQPMVREQRCRVW
jgi:endothelin-converting enzyme/putative endopeptidase